MTPRHERLVDTRTAGVLEPRRLAAWRRLPQGRCRRTED